MASQALKIFTWSLLVLCFAESARGFRLHRDPNYQLLLAAQAAIDDGDAMKLRELLREGLDPNQKAPGCRDRDAPLVHFAAAKGEAECLHLLFEHHATLDVVNNCGEKAMHIAAAEGNLNIIKLLADLGSDVDLPDWGQKKKPLHYAAEAGQDKAVELLLKRNAAVDGKEVNGATAAHFAAKANEKNTLKLLLDVRTKTNLEVTDKGGRTLLHYAAKGKAIDTLSFLIRRGASVNATDKKGHTALHYAAMGSQPCVIALIDAKADLNAADKDGETPVSKAVRKADLHIIDELAQAGAAMDVKNAFGQTLKDLAIDTHDDRLYDYFNITMEDLKILYGYENDEE